MLEKAPVVGDEIGSRSTSVILSPLIAPRPPARDERAAGRQGTAPALKEVI